MTAALWSSGPSWTCSGCSSRSGLSRSRASARSERAGFHIGCRLDGRYGARERRAHADHAGRGGGLVVYVDAAGLRPTTVDLRIPLFEGALRVVFPDPRVE